ncbi:N-6 DNA methylase [Streptomyces sp. c-19]|uniref:N-6 DNA methylase n=1 Tax=Streptomyces sp. c-19 TaxID=2789275 RepID=UPI003980F707
MQETRSQVDWLARAVDVLRGAMTGDTMQQLILSAVFLRRVSDVPEAVAQGRPTWRDLLGQVSGDGHAVQVVQQALRAWSGDYGRLRLDLADDPMLGAVRPTHVRADQVLRDLFAVLAQAGRSLTMVELYEQCLARFSEDRAGGDYYTPRGVVRTMVGLMAPEPGDDIYDPACGSGGFLIEAARYVKTQGGRPEDPVGPPLRLFGQDVNARTRRIAAMNLVLHDLADDMRRDLDEGDSLLDGSEAGEKYDVVFANPPFSMRWDRGNDRFVPWRYGSPPKSKADFAWVQHVVGALKPHGRAAVLLANGAAFRGGAEQHIRAGLVHDDVLAAVIQLPPGLFPHTRIPACLWVFDKSKQAHAKNRILFVDAQDAGTQVSRGRRVLAEEDVDRIVGTFRGWGERGEDDEQGWSRTLTLEEIEAADFDLQPGRHVMPVVAEATPGADERRVRELTEELYGQFAEAARLERELRDALEAL